MSIFRQNTIKKVKVKSNKIKNSAISAICISKIIQKCLSVVLGLFLMVELVPKVAFGTENFTVNEDGNWTISTAQGLVSFRNTVNSGTNFSGITVTLEEDIDLSSVCNVNSPWIPIGTSTKKFEGTFDGNGKTISNLYIGPGDYLGLFGNLNSSEVKNLNLKNVNTVYPDQYVGAICGYAEGTTIKDCVIKDGDIKGSTYVGGICGSTNSDTTITNCKFNGKVVGTETTGGICGKIDNGSTIKKCEFNGNVEASENAGGICGLVMINADESNVEECVFNGEVLGGSHIGGICGTAYCNISKCLARGTVTGIKNYIGGIVGQSKGERTISECASFVDVSGKYEVGGISGGARNTINCYATGNISGESQLGGIVGSVPGATEATAETANSVTNCYFSGTITGSGHVYNENTPKICYIGGINGYDIRGESKNCVCLSYKIQGTGDPRVDVIAWINALYLREKEGTKGPEASDPAIPDNDEKCYYRVDLGSAPAIGYSGEAFEVESGWQQIFIVDLDWDSSIWNIPVVDIDSPDYSIIALPTLKNVTAEQNPSLGPKKTPKWTDFVFIRPKNLVWNSKPKAIIIKPKEGITGMGEITVKYIKINDDGTEGEASTTPPSDTGRYRVKFDVAEGPAYAAVENFPAFFES